MSWTKTARLLTINFLVFVALLLTLEGIFQVRAYFLFRASPSSSTETQTYFSSDKTGKLKQNNKKSFNNSKAIYDVNYFYSSKFPVQRRVENQAHKTNTKYFFIAAGCSFTFGEGLNQGDDYPSQLSKKLGPQWRVYNFGSRGGAPNKLLANVTYSEMNYYQVKEEQGIAVWLFMQDHFRRVDCPLSCYQQHRAFALNNPYYTLGPDGLQLQGTFRSNKSLKVLLLKLLGKSETLRQLHINFDNPNDPDKIKLFYELLNASFNLLEQQHNKKFRRLLIIYSSRPENEKQLKEFAAKYGVEVLDFRPTLLSQEHEKSLTIEGDGHPTKEANQLLVETISKYIQGLPEFNARGGNRP